MCMFVVGTRIYLITKFVSFCPMENLAVVVPRASCLQACLGKEYMEVMLLVALFM